MLAGFSVWRAFGDTIMNVLIATNPDLESGLIGHWTFDGKDMNPNVRDRSGQGNHGNAIYGASGNTSTTTAPGRIGQAMDFDGTDDFVDMGDSSDWDSLDTITFSMWFKADILSGTNQLGGNLDNDDDDSGFAIYWYNNELVFAIYDGALELAKVSFTTVNTWIHVVGVAPGSGNGVLKIYINGSELTYTVQESQTGTIANSADNVIIGANADTISRYFSGFIDDVRVYNRALSASEIQRLYDLGATTHINTTIETNSDLRNGLVGHWTFDGKDMGPNVRDRSGQGNHGNAIYGASGNTSTTTAPGRIGQALDFDNTDDYVDITGGSYESDTQGTIAGWFFSEFADSDAVVEYGGANVAGNPPAFGLELKNTSKIEIFHRDAAGGQSDILNSTTALNPNTWYHVALTSNGSTWTLYIDGETENMTVAEGANSGDWFGDCTPGDPAKTYIGALRWDGSNLNFFNGLLDDIRIYNRALSASEINRLYDLGATTHVNTTITTNPDLESGLVGHWTFDGKDMGPNVRDRSGQGNHGNAIYGASGNTSTTTTPGRIGQALEFDGTDDYILLGNATNLARNVSAATVAAWVKSDLNNAKDRILVDITTGTVLSSRFEIKDRSNADIGNFHVGGRAGDGESWQEEVTTTAPLTRGWHHIVGIIDYFGDDIKIYVDGVEQLTSGTPSFVAESTSDTAPLGAYIGVDGDGSGQEFDGLIDDVRIYNRALSASEIQRLYDLGR
jgi:hypothetical protein